MELKFFIIFFPKIYSHFWDDGRDSHKKISLITFISRLSLHQKLGASWRKFNNHSSILLSSVLFSYSLEKFGNTA